MHRRVTSEILALGAIFCPLRCSCGSIPLDLHMAEEKVARSLPVAAWSYQKERSVVLACTLGKGKHLWG